MDSFLCHGYSTISIVYKYKGYCIYIIWIKYIVTSFNFVILPDPVICNILPIMKSNLHCFKAIFLFNPLSRNTSEMKLLRLISNELLRIRLKKTSTISQNVYNYTFLISFLQSNCYQLTKITLFDHYTSIPDIHYSSHNFTHTFQFSSSLFYCQIKTQLARNFSSCYVLTRMEAYDWNKNFYSIVTASGQTKFMCDILQKK